MSRKSPPVEKAWTELDPAKVAPSSLPYSHTHYERFWAAASDLRMPLSVHVFTGTRPELDGSVDFLTGYALLPAAAQSAIGAMLCSGVMQRHPGLRLISVELDIGWIPTFLRRLDHAWHHHRHWSGAGRDLELPPSEYFRRQVAATFMDDPAGLAVHSMHYMTLNERSKVFLSVWLPPQLEPGEKIPALIETTRFPDQMEAGWLQNVVQVYLGKPTGDYGTAKSKLDV